MKLTTLRSGWINMALGIGALAFLGMVIGMVIGLSTNQQWDRMRAPRQADPGCLTVSNQRVLARLHDVRPPSR